MSQDNFPHPVSDPEAHGFPEVADDDSLADEVVPSVREADGPSPAPLPADRDVGPVAVEDFGVTPDEERQGESLDSRLRREEPDVWPPADTPLNAEELDGGPIEPNPGSPVSVYERLGSDDAPVGRLVAPDEGGGNDADAEEFAYDAGPAGGGATMEELAMHPVDQNADVIDFDDR